MKKDLVVFIGSILLALAMAAIAWWGFFNVSRVYAIYLIPTGVWVFNARTAWRSYGSYRRANRNSGSTGPGGGTVYHPIHPHSGVTTFGSIYPISTTPYSWYMGAGEGTSLRKVDEPFRAWKWAILERAYPTERGKIVFTPLNDHHPKYGAVDIAQCGSIAWHYAMTEEDRRALRHRVADPDHPCSCGFYGYKDRNRAMEMVPALHMMGREYQPDEVLFVLLEVDFYGRVIVHTEGYRAEKQRVLAMHVPDTQKGRWWYEMRGGQPEVEWQWWKLPSAYTDYKEGTF